MKVSEVIFENPNNDCELCLLHETVTKQIVSDVVCECPRCREQLVININDYGLTTIGETNTADPAEQIGIYPMALCSKCSGYFALMPVAIQYNGNHDIYCTGGKKYLGDWYSESELIKRMLPSAKQFTDRVRAGETQLTEWNVACWLSREAQSYLAEKLYEQGLTK